MCGSGSSSLWKFVMTGRRAGQLVQHVPRQMTGSVAGHDDWN
jgi:hypothetical protein